MPAGITYVLASHKEVERHAHTLARCANRAGHTGGVHLANSLCLSSTTTHTRTHTYAHTHIHTPTHTHTHTHRHTHKRCTHTHTTAARAHTHTNTHTHTTHARCAQIVLPNTKIALRLHSQIPELHSDCTPDDQDSNPKIETASLGARLERCCTLAQTNLTAI